MATIYAANSEKREVIGSTNTVLAANTKYTLRVAGLRNPRYRVDNSKIAGALKQYWELYTYD